MKRRWSKSFSPQVCLSGLRLVISVEHLDVRPQGRTEIYEPLHIATSCSIAFSMLAFSVSILTMKKSSCRFDRNGSQLDLVKDSECINQNALLMPRCAKIEFESNISIEEAWSHIWGRMAHNNTQSAIHAYWACKTLHRISSTRQSNCRVSYGRSCGNVTAISDVLGTHGECYAWQGVNIKEVIESKAPER